MHCELCKLEITAEKEEESTNKDGIAIAFIHFYSATVFSYGLSSLELDDAMPFSEDLKFEKSVSVCHVCAFKHNVFKKCHELRKAKCDICSQIYPSIWAGSPTILGTSIDEKGIRPSWGSCYDCHKNIGWKGEIPKDILAKLPHSTQWWLTENGMEERPWLGGHVCDPCVTKFKQDNLLDDPYNIIDLNPKQTDNELILTTSTPKEL